MARSQFRLVKYNLRNTRHAGWGGAVKSVQHPRPFFQGMATSQSLMALSIAQFKVTAASNADGV